MKEEQAHVREFMVKADQPLPDRPTLPPIQIRIGRLKWIAEELCELANAYGVEIDLNNHGNTTGNFATFQLPPEKCQFQDPMDALTQAYDATLDLLVFGVGTGLAMGTDLTPGWLEVHRTNMLRFGPGGYKRADGKWIRPPDWQPPNLKAIILHQIEYAEAADAVRKSQAELGL